MKPNQISGKLEKHEKTKNGTIQSSGPSTKDESYEIILLIYFMLVFYFRVNMIGNIV